MIIPCEDLNNFCASSQIIPKALNNFQAQFNEALIAMYAGYHPESTWSPVNDYTADNMSEEEENR